MLETHLFNSAAYHMPPVVFERLIRPFEAKHLTFGNVSVRFVLAHSAH